MPKTTQPTLNRAKLVDWLMMAIILGLLGWAAFSTMQPPPLEQLVGQPAPPFELKTQSGEVTGPSDFEGKVVLLDFWATWCEPCFEQMPAIQQVSDEFGDDLVVLPVNIDDPSPNRDVAMKRFLEEAGVDVDSLIDDGSVANMYEIDKIPALVVIGPDGIVRWASAGVHPKERLADAIRDATRDGTEGT